MGAKKIVFFVIKIQSLIIKVAVATTRTYIILLLVPLNGQLFLFIVMQFNFLDIY
jgi:hypothetical protein